MKVSETGGPQKTQESRRKGRSREASGTGFGDYLKAAQADSETAGVASAGPVGAMESLLAAQEVDATDPDERRRQLREHGEQVLERLDEIRHGLLSGELSESRLYDLARLVREKRGATDDPRLAEILDEIELRAQVELAKLSRAT